MIPYLDYTWPALVHPPGLLTLLALEESPLPHRFRSPSEYGRSGITAFQGEDDTIMVNVEGDDASSLSMDTNGRIQISGLFSGMTAPLWNVLPGIACFLTERSVRYVDRAGHKAIGGGIEQSVRIEIDCNIIHRTARASACWEEVVIDTHSEATTAQRVLVMNGSLAQHVRVGCPDHLLSERLNSLNEALALLPRKRDHGIPERVEGPLSSETEQRIRKAFLSSGPQPHEEKSSSRISLDIDCNDYMVGFDPYYDNPPIDMRWRWWTQPGVNMAPGAREFVTNLSGRIPTGMFPGTDGRLAYIPLVLIPPVQRKTPGYQNVWAELMGYRLIEACYRLHQYHAVMWVRAKKVLSELGATGLGDIDNSSGYPNKLLGW